MNNAYLLIGGNIGNREKNLDMAMRFIDQHANIKVVSVSSVYETAAWGITSQHAFLNMALEISTTESPEQLLDIVLDIEQQMGRRREEKFGPRVIDIDIIFFNNEVIDLPQLSVPHPALPFRRFALEPLNDIAPGYLHPVLKKTVNTLLQQCEDTLSVRRYAAILPVPAE